MWKNIEGYRYAYRISEEAIIERQLPSGRWRRIQPYLNSNVARVSLVTSEGRTKNVGVSTLVLNAFCGGRDPTKCYVHKNGAKLDCSIYNLKAVARSTCCSMSGRGKRKAVCSIDREGHVLEVFQQLAKRLSTTICPENQLELDVST